MEIAKEVRYVIGTKRAHSKRCQFKHTNVLHGTAIPEEKRTHEVCPKRDQQKRKLAKDEQIRHDCLSWLWWQPRANKCYSDTAAGQHDEAYDSGCPRKANLWDQTLQTQREDDSSKTTASGPNTSSEPSSRKEEMADGSE